MGLANTGDEEALEDEAEHKQWEWQKVLQLVMDEQDLSIWGLCNFNHRKLTTMRDVGVGITKRET